VFVIYMNTYTKHAVPSKIGGSYASSVCLLLRVLLFCLGLGKEIIARR